MHIYVKNVDLLGRDQMGNVAIKIKIMPDSPEVDLEKLKENIASKLNIKDWSIEPIAFGLKALKVLIISPDTAGTEQIEQKIKNINGVAEVEVESSTLI